MKQFTHAWLAFMAIKRLENIKPILTADERVYADSLINWFQSHKDGVIQGAWYPDKIIVDNANSHVLKIAPYDESLKNVKKIPPEGFKALPAEYLIYKCVKESPMRKKAFCLVDEKDNLPDRCESFTQSVIDHLKIQQSEERGSPVLPTSNHVALLLFMLSHYIADAHVPVHCDSRKFSDGKDLHGNLEKEWDEEVQKFYKIDARDKSNERFYYDEAGYPSREYGPEEEYPASYLKKVEDELNKRAFGKINTLFGTGNKNVWDFMSAVCQNSYLLSYHYLTPEDIPDPAKAVLKDWKAKNPDKFKELSIAVLADAVDSIARIWLRVWRRYEDWRPKDETKQGNKKKTTVNP